MDQTQFAAAEPHLDALAETLDGALQSPDLGKLREALTALGKVFGERHSVSLTCLVEVFDETNGRTLPLLNTGLCAASGQG